MGVMLQIIQQNSAYETYNRTEWPKIEDPNATNKTRYKFENKTNRETALEYFFNRAFEKNAAAVIAAAEQEGKSTFYPKWKSVCWIEIPRIIGSVINHPVTKIALMVAATYHTWLVGLAAYRLTVQWTAPKLTFIINNTPVQIIRLGNMAIDLTHYVRKSLFEILLYVSIARIILSYSPNNNFVSRLVHRFEISILIHILYAPITLFDFLFSSSVDVAEFTWINCTNVGLFIKGRAELADKERLAICREKALKVWLQVNNSSNGV